MPCNFDRFQYDGTNQIERFPVALEENYLRIDERTEEDLYQYMRRIAGMLRYYNLDNFEQGNWQVFLPDSYQDFLELKKAKPHLTLIWVFLQMYRDLQEQLNSRKIDHTRYYYEQVLQLKRKPGRPSKAFVKFELNRQTQAVRLEKGTRFSAGEVEGRERFFTLDNDLVVNRASIVALKNILIDRNNQNRIFCAAVANSTDGLGKEMIPPGKSWRPFGESQAGKTAQNASMMPARVGLAFSSNVLLLGEGKRTVTITLTSKDDLPYFQDHFKILVSGEKGWNRVLSFSLRREGKKLTFRFTLAPEFPPVTALGAPLPDDQFQHELPAVLILLDEDKNNLYYENLQSIVILDVAIEVYAEQLRKTCEIQSGNLSLDPGKPFQPFGNFPQKGMYFTVTNREMTLKVIYELGLSMVWRGDGKNNEPIYVETGAKINDKKLDESRNSFSFVIEVPSFGKDLYYYGEVTNTPPVFINYPKQLADAIKSNSTVPEPPVAPVIESFDFSYKAKAKYTDISIVRIEPFGACVLTKDSTGFTFLPQWEEEAALYIGFENLPDPLLLPLLWEFEANPDGDVVPPPVVWSVLRGNEWQLLAREQIATDQTLNWQQNGIITLEIPDLNSRAGTSILPSGLRWLKAAVKQSPEWVNAVIGIHTQAAAVTEVMYEGAGPAAYPAESIQKIEYPVPGIKKISQPLSSTGGQPNESEHQFFTRSAERLRHKNRAVCLWDFERLVLENFPQIFKVKCIAHTAPNSYEAHGAVTLLVIPGFNERTAQANPFEPVTGRLLRKEIKAFLEKYAAMNIEIYIENPVYEQVLVDLKVKFRDGFDPGYYRGQLLLVINKLLSPWAYDQGEDILFENKIHKSVLWKYIEKLPYVDYIANFSMYHAHQSADYNGIGCMEIGLDFKIWDPPVASIAGPGMASGVDMAIGESFIVGFDVEQASATTPRSVLVSSRYHRIETISGNDYPCNGIADIGIGQMILEWDFVLSDVC